MNTKFTTRIILVLGLLVLNACSHDKEAAELVNSVVHFFDLTATETQTIPQDLMSGPCRNTINAGGLASYTATALPTGQVRVNLSINFTFAGTCPGPDCIGLQCDLIADYGLSSDHKRFTGGGNLATCDAFKCTLRQSPVSCEDMKKALKENPCSFTNTL